ncbi:hypothetical protein PSMK_08230 [Phycisphaera mikurensis NBRC 102666]|uniref:Rhs family protein n=1 Tax=Phycisphaera mikurensis (strain NBRC 102666 / KCTC 22515 / FYK2301M01) TaxID=1142394 RepID=I0ICJ4_PHYMF|nr:hypothetical protein PSMK_08230 [Phycisphaera mikurensis NBRC 102666]
MITHTDIRRHRPTLLIGPRVGAQGQPFRATFSFTRSTASRNHDMLKFLFGVEEEGTYNVLAFSHKGGSPWAPSGSRLEDASGISVAGTRTAAHAVSTPNPSDRVWVRVASDGAAVTAKMLLDNTGPPSEAAWSGAGEAYRSTAFPMNGGRVGFRSAYGVAFVRHFTLETDHDNDGSWTREYDALIDHPGGHATIRYEHDAAGNLTFDGVFSYAYDAWNRLVSVRNAYREAGAGQSVQEGSVVTAMAYDGLGRRTTRAVQNSGNLDFTHHAYFDGQRQVEERNGSDLVLRQQVWGLDYIDELVSTSLNFDPTDTTESVCERHFYALHDSQYNILGIVAAGGALVERYEYTPYGQRQVYGSGTLKLDVNGDGSQDQDDTALVQALVNDPTHPDHHLADIYSDGQINQNDVSAMGEIYAFAYYDGPEANHLDRSDLKRLTPRLGTTRGPAYAAWLTAPVYTTLNPFGHQGLHHDEATGLIYNRARMLHPTLGRFVQRDPLGNRVSWRSVRPRFTRNREDGRTMMVVSRAEDIAYVLYPQLQYFAGMSLYEYAASSPRSLVDPTGLVPWPAIVVGTCLNESTDRCQIIWHDYDNPKDGGDFELLRPGERSGSKDRCDYVYLNGEWYKNRSRLVYVADSPLDPYVKYKKTRGGKYLKSPLSPVSRAPDGPWYPGRTGKKPSKTICEKYCECNLLSDPAHQGPDCDDDCVKRCEDL